VPPKTSPLLVTPTFTGGRPSRNIFSKAPFLRWFSFHQRVLQRRLEVDDRRRRAEVGRAAVCSGSFRSSVRMLYSFLK
jgi:hypothetical protein